MPLVPLVPRVCPLPPSLTHSHKQVSWAAAVFRFVPRCPQLENWVSLLWASVLAASLAWAHFGPNSYARYREHLMAGLRITRWAYPCIARPTVYIGLSAAGAEGSGSGSCSGFLSCWHQGAAGPLAILLLVPVMQLQAALGYHVRLPWAAVVLAGELALTLPRQCALCADPLMQPGQQGGAVVHALHSTFSFLLGTGTAPGSGLSGGAGSRGSSAGNQCWAVVVMLELVLGFLLPLAVTSARERAAFSRFYRHHRGWVQCDSCCAVYLMSVAGDGNSVGGAAGSLDSGSPVQPAPSAGQARRWVRWAQIAACSFALLWVQWDIITELSALRQP